jgi:hypothetical protein
MLFHWFAKLHVFGYHRNVIGFERRSLDVEFSRTERTGGSLG